MSANLDYRSFLQAELLLRQKSNPRYSSRAFSRDLKVTPSFLSQLFKKRKNLSERKAAEILERMPWNEERKQLFWTAFRFEVCENTQLKAKFEKELRCYKPGASRRNLQGAEFRLIADWYHFAILELVRRPDFQNSVDWIARQLRLPVKTVAAALNRLKKLGLLNEIDGKLAVTSDFYTQGEVSREAIRRNHDQHLRLAQSALWEQAVDERHFSGITMAIDPARLPEAEKMIQDFRRKLMRFLEAGEQKQVYRMSVQLFRLDKLAPQERENR